MLNNLAYVIPDAVQIDIAYQDQNILVKVFAKVKLNGTMNINVNKTLLKHVQTYTSDSNQFSLLLC